MSSLSEIHDRLRHEWSALESQWHSTREQWDDVVGERFEKEFWHVLDEEIPNFLRDLQQLDDTLDQAFRRLSHG
jgi:hypothetical protein